MGKRRWRAIATTAVVSALIASSVAFAPVAGAASAAPTPVVQGNHLVDSRTNSVFVPHGVNWPSFEYACWQGWGYSSNTSMAEAEAIASWKVTAVRIPLNQDCWLGLAGSPTSGTKQGYRAALRSWVDTLNAAGLVVILDLHSTAPAGYPAHGQRAMADSQSVAFWQSVAAAYSTSPSVMFDVFNEPYSRWNSTTNAWTFHLTWDCWKNGGCQAPVEDDYTASLSGSTFTVAGMSQLVAAVRGAGAAQPIMLGGLDYSNDLTGWLANRPADAQLVASWHNYPGQRCDSVTCWNAEVAPVAAIVPVVTGEFGETDGGNSYLTNFMAWADGLGIGYAPWAWWRVSSTESLDNSRYALIGDTGFAPKAPAGTAYYSHLAGLPTTSVIQVSRISGDERYATAVAISHAWVHGAQVVYLATGANYPDALSAAPAAAVAGGPLLLTPPDSLPTIVRDEIVRLAPTTIVVVGGEQSISAAVVAELSGLATSVRRDAGIDRYETSREINAHAFTTPVAAAFVATGATFPDALSASAAAGAHSQPVVLVNGALTAVDAPTAILLKALDPSALTLAGGPASISLGMEDALRATIAAVQRLGGTDRYATSGAINRGLFTTAPIVYLATGSGFADALAGAALAGRDHAPLYVVPSTCVPGYVLEDLVQRGTKQVVLLGGDGVLGAAVESLTSC